jgi:hypothetical protein
MIFLLLFNRKYNEVQNEMYIINFKVKDYVDYYKELGYKKVSVVSSYKWKRFGLNFILLVLLF